MVVNTESRVLEQLHPAIAQDVSEPSPRNEDSAKLPMSGAKTFSLCSSWLDDAMIHSINGLHREFFTQSIFRMNLFGVIVKSSVRRSEVQQHPSQEQAVIITRSLACVFCASARATAPAGPIPTCRYAMAIRKRTAATLLFFYYLTYYMVVFPFTLLYRALGCTAASFLLPGGVTS